MSDTGRTIYAIVSEVFAIPINDLNDNIDWRDYDVESFAMIELIIAIQTEFCIQFSTVELARLDNLGEIVALTKKKIEDV